MRLVAILALVGPAVVFGQNPCAAVSGRVAVVRQGRSPAGSPDHSNAVVWLTPVKGTVPAPSPQRRFEIRQHHKRFEPHVLAVPVGSAVAFPNLDPFLHNVFSMFDGKRFDLGLYEAGASHSVTFDRVGVCFIFCNIHPEMSAMVVVVDSPYYAVSDAAGALQMAEVPSGRYLLHVLHERGKPKNPGDFPREISIAGAHFELPGIQLIDAGQLSAPHKNKYGRDYESPNPPAILYK